jgi:hypothetical protein
MNDNRMNESWWSNVAGGAVAEVFGALLSALLEIFSGL